MSDDEVELVQDATPDFGPHPYFDDSVAQRTYAVSILLAMADNLSPEGRQLAMDFANGVLRSVASQEAKVQRVK